MSTARYQTHSTHLQKPNSSPTDLLSDKPVWSSTFLMSSNSCDLSLASQHKYQDTAIQPLLSMHKFCTEPLRIKNWTRSLFYTVHIFSDFFTERIALVSFFVLSVDQHWILDKMKKETKTKILFFIILVGSVSMLTAVVTDHWAVLSPRVENVNTTCEAAHFGLWRLCKKYIYIEDAELVGKSCGPISLPGGK